MKAKTLSLLALTAAVGLTSCSKLGTLDADNFTVTPNPLEAVDNQVPAVIAGRFPEKYMKKKAVVKVIPVLRFADGQAVGSGATFQGEKVQGNNQEISYRVGGNYSLRTVFPYRPEMQKSELYLTFDARLGKKQVKVPDVKVADGVIATSTLLAKTAGTANAALGEDNFQYAIEQKQQAQIKYLISQSQIRTSALQTTSVQDFIKTLRDIKADQKGLELGNIEVSAYASPDGGQAFNDKLAQAREQTSERFVQEQLKKLDLEADVNSRYTAQDWEGFQELVGQSNLQDKDVILRVLSMYKDPEEREQQIRNLSAGFQELADEILPELRRARLTINYLTVGRSDDEIEQQFQADASQLSNEELLYAATLTDDAARKASIYQKTAQLFPNDYRALNNLGVLAYENGNYAAAKTYFQEAAGKNANAPEMNANLALVSLCNGDSKTAEDFLTRATTAKNYGEVLGNLAVARGQYAQAAQQLKGINTNTAALSQILSKDYAAALQTLSNVSQPDGVTSYLKAIVASRTRQNAEALTLLRQAIQQDSSLKDRAKNDLEFAALAGNAEFQNLVK